MVDTIGREVLPHLSGHVSLLGHSMGAVLAVELARWLDRHQGAGPELVILSGCRGGGHLDGDTLSLLTADETEQVAWLTDVAGGTSAELLADSEMRTLVVEALVHDLDALARHSPRTEPLTTPLLALAGADDPLASPEAVGAWRHRTTEDFHLRVIPGGHFFILEHPEEAVAALHQAWSGLTEAPDNGGKRDTHA